MYTITETKSRTTFSRTAPLCRKKSSPPERPDRVADNEERDLVLHLLTGGYSREEIADELGLSVRTVSRLLQHLRERNPGRDC
jgi:DNA-binding NarL/FixJ family response regulator